MTKTLPRLERDGDRWVLPIDAELLRDAGIDPETGITLDSLGGRIVVSSGGDLDRQQRLAQIAEEMDRRYGRMMQRLAQ